jgi:hypothetical protein
MGGLLLGEDKIPEEFGVWGSKSLTPMPRHEE